VRSIYARAASSAVDIRSVHGLADCGEIFSAVSMVDEANVYS